LGEDEFMDDEKSVDYDFPGDDGDHMDYEVDQPQLIDLEYLDSIGN
jgi:hypothetical protein